LPTVFDVPPDPFIHKLANYLKEEFPQVTPPSWAQFVKTGAHAERQPQNPDWWYVRAASIFRKVYLNGPIGVARLRREYGGRKSAGSTPYHKRDGGGNIIRKILQQLENAGLIEKKDGEGRVVADKGRALLDSLSAELKRELERTIPGLKKY